MGLSFSGEGELSYQVISSFHTPFSQGEQQSALAIDVAYDPPETKTGGVVSVDVSLSNVSATEQNMVMAGVGVPPGFSVLPSKLDEAVKDDIIKNDEIHPTSVVLYAGTLDAGAEVPLGFQMKATLAVDATTPGSTAYLYYNPETRSETQPVPISVSE